jgi:hypothetical protein
VIFAMMTAYTTDVIWDAARASRCRDAGSFEACPNRTHECSNALRHLANADTRIILE